MKPVFHPTAELLAQRCQQAGIAAWISSPGSRHAPLVQAFGKWDSCPHAVLLDERSAGHFALGAALEWERPVVVLCTSGTAALNFGPAAAEAFYRRLPLIFITADRPKAHIDHGHGQSVRQEDFLSPHVATRVVLEEDQEGNSDEKSRALFERNAKKIDEALRAAWSEGPVHINVPFREPLYGVVSIPDPWIIPSFVLPPKEKPEPIPAPLLSAVQQANCVWVVVGQSSVSTGVKRADWLLDWMQNDARLRVIAEPLANLGEGPWTTPEVALQCAEKGEWPQVLLTLSGAFVSKKFRSKIQASPAVHWHLGSEKTAPNQFDCLVGRWNTEEPWSLSASSRWEHTPPFQKCESEPAAFAAETLTDQNLTDEGVYAYLLQHVPKDTRLHVTNSTAVRYMNALDAPGHPLRLARVECNRGASGIDGCTSTAVGMNWASNNRSTWLLSGDLAFFYDANGLFHPHVGTNFVAFVINNGGGSIFRMIDGPASTGRLEQDFVAAHQRSVLPMAAGFGCDVYSVRTVEELVAIVDRIRKEPGKSPRVVEIVTDPQVSENV